MVLGAVGSPRSGCSACHISAHLAKHRTLNASGSPPSPLPPYLACKPPVHIPTATSAQPRPSSLPAGSQQPLPPLPTPCPSPGTTSETRKAEKPLEKAGPKPHLATSAPAGARAPACSTAWDCPRCRDLFPDLLLPRSCPDTEGTELHILGAGIHLPPRSCTL